MYKVLLVDDEAIELEGLEKLVPWENLQAEVIGNASNGEKAYELIEKEVPDIVITDIQMPIMTGIELLEKTRKTYPQVEFIILSGYGEYEYTSRAMLEGVRHYVLKPFDEEKIVSAVEHVIENIEIQKKEENRKAVETIQNRKMKTKAVQQVFREALLERDFVEETGRKLSTILEMENTNFRILLLNKKRPFDNLEIFSTVNILNELFEMNGMEQGICAFTSLKGEMVILIKAVPLDLIKEMVSQLQEKMLLLIKEQIKASLSGLCDYAHLQMCYLEARELLDFILVEPRISFISPEEGTGEEGTAQIIDYQGFHSCHEYADLLFRTYLFLLKMDLEKKSQEEKMVFAEKLIHIFDRNKIRIENIANNEELFEFIVKKLSPYMNQGIDEKEFEKDCDMLKIMYLNMKNVDFNLKYMAKNILFMSEDYVGKRFQKRWGSKFTKYLQETRIKLAGELIAFQPECRLTDVAVLTGFAEDGQYFSRLFKKVMGIAPSDYKQNILT